jgi:hypothetical protein
MITRRARDFILDKLARELAHIAAVTVTTIARRADMRQDADGAWRHSSEPSPRHASESRAA